MLEKSRLDRINELARKAKEEGLTPGEKKEQEALRKEYIEAFRANFKSRLDQIRFVEDLSEEELAAMNKTKGQQN